MDATTTTLPARPSANRDRFEADRSAPVSSGQRRLWFLEQMEPGLPLYNIPYLVRMGGALDEHALRRALAAVVERHEALRTHFVASGSEPVQVVADSWELDVPVTDLGGFRGEPREDELRRLANEEARRPFDLKSDLMLRARLFRLGEDGHALMLVTHHIAFDGWSMAVLYAELGAYYEAFAQGRPHRLPELPVQYADFAEWQAESLQGETMRRLTEFWKEKLSGAPALLELPTDRPRPPTQSHRGDTVSLRLAPETVGSLKRMGAQARVTFFMTLLAAFKALLHRYSGQSDIVVGTPTAGRDCVETEGLIGFFVNTVIVRTDLSGDPTVKDLLERVRESSLAAFEHREMPYDRLVEALQPQRNLSYDPICQTVFILQNAPVAPLMLDGIELKIEPIYTGTSKSDLTLSASEEPDGSVRLDAEYATDLFNKDTIERFVGHYEALLGEMAAGSGRRLSQLSILTEAEKAQSLVAWNATKAEFAEGSLIHDLFEAQVRRTPDAVAVVFNERELTYAELNARADRLAARLHALGPGPDALVGICVERSPEMMIGLLGILKSGAAYVPLDPAYPKERLAFMIEDSQAGVLVTQLSLVPDLPAHRAAVVCVDEERDETETPEAPQRVAAKPENLAYVLYTSGSTGAPKGVMVTHRNVVNFFAGMDRVIGPEAGVWLATTSISFDISVLELFWTLTRGFKVIILPESAKVPGLAAALAAKKKTLDFSLFYFASEDPSAEPEGGGRYRLLIEGAKFADAHGFKAVWTPERHFHSFGGLFPNPSVTGAALAAITSRVQIRAGSCVTPLHHPARVAEEWSVVDNLSGGRVGISVANGWHDRDFALQPQNFAERREVMRTSVETIRRLWRGEAVSFPGGRGNSVEVRIYPRPVQKELPVWVTAAGNPETFKLAGELNANVLTHLLGQDLDELAKKIRIYRRARRDAGNEGEGCVTIALHTFVGEDREAVRAKVKEPLMRYLADSADLLKGLSQAMLPGCEMKDLTAEEMRGLVEFAFNRYFELCGLLGTPDTCRETLGKLSAIGVDEVACLIDFGVDAGAALGALELLDRVRADFQANGNAAAPDAAAPAQPLSLVEQMRRQGVTHLQCTPSYARMLMQAPDTAAALESVRKLMVGGEALPTGLAETLLQRLPAEIINMYGPTETTIWSATHPVKGEPSSTGAVAIGRPIANTRLYVLDPGGQPQPVGVPGELWIGGEGVARGYWRRPDLTAERFTADPFAPRSGAPARRYRTGDLVRFRADGVIDFLGRVDHQVKVRGHRIELGEIEAALARHSSVRQAVAALRKDNPDNPQLVAYFVPSAGGAAEAGALREFLREKLPEHMVPSLYVALDKLPLTPNGKVNRAALPAPQARRAEPPGGRIPPQGVLEETLAAIWKDILRVEGIGAEDNFFDLGGHSLQVVQVQNRLRADIGAQVSVLKLFQFPTVRSLAGFIGERQSSDGDSAFHRRIDERIRLRRQAAVVRRRTPADAEPPGSP